MYNLGYRARAVQRTSMFTQVIWISHSIESPRSVAATRNPPRSNIIGRSIDDTIGKGQVIQLAVIAGIAVFNSNFPITLLRHFY